MQRPLCAPKRTALLPSYLEVHTQIHGPTRKRGLAILREVDYEYRAKRQLGTLQPARNPELQVVVTLRPYPPILEDTIVILKYCFFVVGHGSDG